MTWTAAGETPAYMSPAVIEEYVQAVGRMQASNKKGQLTTTVRHRRPSWMAPGRESGGTTATSNSSDDNLNKAQREVDTWHGPDVYAFAIILWELLTLREPWDDVGDHKAMWDCVRRGERPSMIAEEAAAAPPGYVALMRAMWADNAASRPTFGAAVEELGAVLKENTTLKSMDLSINQIGDAGAADIAAALKENSTLLRLYLYNNQIGDPGAAAIVAALKENSTLQELVLRRNHIGDAAKAELRRAWGGRSDMLYL